MEIIKFSEKKKESYWKKGEIWFDLFKKYVRFSSKNLTSSHQSYVISYAEHLNQLPEETSRKLCESSIKYCIDMENLDIEFNHYLDIIPYISNCSIILLPPLGDNKAVLYIIMDCEWEQEHGMSWAIKGNDVLYVGSFFGSPESIDRFLSRRDDSYANNLDYVNL